MDDQVRHVTTYSKLFIWSGIACWTLALMLSILQAGQEAVRWATPYGLVYLRSLIIPILSLLLFYLLALIQVHRIQSSIHKPQLWSQLFFLGLVLALTYWAAVAPLRHNWILLLGVWWLLPSLYLARTEIIATTTLLSLGSVLFTVILFELLLQPFPRLWPGYARMVGSNWRRIHADIPGAEFEDKGIHYQINQLGFRGAKTAPDEVEIVTLGDSFTFGVGVQQPWPERLSDILDARVLNLGMGGTDPPKHVYPLIAYGLPRNPEVVIEAYFEGNDLFTCYQPAIPSGPRWGDNLVLPNLIGGIGEMVRFIQRDETITSELTYDSVTPFVRSIGGQQVELTFSPAYTATLLLDQETILASENWRIARGSLLRMAELSLEKGATFILVYLPDRSHVYWPLIREDDDLLTQLNQDMNYAWRQRLDCLALARGRIAGDLETFRTSMDSTHTAQRDLLRDFASTHEIPFLDLTRPLRQLAEQGIILADPLETHYNDFVNQVLAQEIADFIQALDP